MERNQKTKFKKMSTLCIYSYIWSLIAEVNSCSFYFWWFFNHKIMPCFKQRILEKYWNRRTISATC